MPNYSGIWTEQAVMQAVGAGNWPGNPGAPTIGTATVSNTTATVTFTAPTDNGGSAITGYTVTSSPGSLTGTGSASPITVSGLTNGTAYTFTVTATNATGTGPASAASNSVTPVPPVYIEDVYSTYVYTGTGATQAITNGIDFATKGGLFWTKRRSGVLDHYLTDTVTGTTKYLSTNLTSAQGTTSTLVTPSSTGFSFSSNTLVNANTASQVVWSFAKQPKFFDVVTYTGTGSTSLTVNHNLGSEPGCIIIKWTSGTGYGWYVYHRSMSGAPQASCMTLNGAGAPFDLNGGSSWIIPSSTNFQVSTTDGGANASGESYVAYLFAHDAGGFGLTGTDNVISCGSFTTDGSGNATVNLGYEPQWLLIKKTSFGGWWLTDTMRGMAVATSSNVKALFAQDSAAEGDGYLAKPNATGFTVGPSSDLGNSITAIYIAIRRGPMKVPTAGTSVFLPTTTSNDSTATNFGFPIDAFWENNLGGTVYNTTTATRLSGNASALYTASTNAASTFLGSLFGGGLQNSYTAGIYGGGNSVVQYGFGRAPSFMDVVCYTGTGTYGAANHNLGVTPELVIYKSRSNAVNWGVIKPVSSIAYYDGILNSTSAFTYYSNDPSVAGLYTSTQFAKYQDTSGYTYVAYLFATCAGVSKVGSYVGDDTVGRVINCGFSSGARFILLKKTSTTSNWYVYDTARGIVSGGEASISLNTTSAQSGSSDVIDPDASGFAVGTGASNFFNETGVSYIFLAIA